MINNSSSNGDSLDKRVENNHVLRLKRNKILLPIAKGLAWFYVKTTSYKHYEIPTKTFELMRHQKKHRDISLCFIESHESMPEVVITPYAISWHCGGDAPFVFSGSNLFKKDSGKRVRLLKYILDRTGVVTVDTEVTPRAFASSLASDVEQIASAYRNLFFFPEGTRSKNGSIQDFNSAAFQGLIDAALKGKIVYIIPVKIDYSHLSELSFFAAHNELETLKTLTFSEPFKYMTKSGQLNSLRDAYYFTHYIDEEKYAYLEDRVRSGIIDYKSLWKEFEEKFEKKYTFKARDMKYWKVHMGDVEISFGESLLVEKNCDSKYRKELAKQSRDMCIDLAKILKIHVVSEAIVRINPEFGAPINNRELYYSVVDVVKDLAPYHGRFRHFSALTRPAEIVKTSGIEINSELLEGYKIYANKIQPYLPKK